MSEVASASSRSEATPSPTSNRGVKNKQPTISLGQRKAKFLEMASVALQAKTKHEPFGESVAADLEAMDNRQCIIAKKLISDVLYHGRLGNLNVNSTLSINDIISHSYSYPLYNNIDDHQQYNSATQIMPMSSSVPRPSVLSAPRANVQSSYPYQSPGTSVPIIHGVEDGTTCDENILDIS